MSRIRKQGNRFMNTNKYPLTVTGTSKMVRIHLDGEDYHYASTLSQWLSIKYDMSYKTYRNKSKTRRDELKREFFHDTDWSFDRYCRKYGKTEDDIRQESEVIRKAWYEEYKIWLEDKINNYLPDNRSQKEIDHDDAMQILADCGVPFAPDGAPLGIGWDD